jgi:hypothetical protein
VTGNARECRGRSEETESQVRSGRENGGVDRIARRRSAGASPAGPSIRSDRTEGGRNSLGQLLDGELFVTWFLVIGAVFGVYP